MYGQIMVAFSHVGQTCTHAWVPNGKTSKPPGDEKLSTGQMGLGSRELSVSRFEVRLVAVDSDPRLDPGQDGGLGVSGSCNWCKYVCIFSGLRWAPNQLKMLNFVLII